MPLRGLLRVAWLLPVCAAAAPVTFSRDVAPILYRHCAACHRAGEVAPFPLLSYADSARRAALIARVTATRYMPPWKPVPGYGEFAGARGLSKEEIATLAHWAEAGAPEGNPSETPAPPPAHSTKLAHPDLVVRMPKPFTIPAEGPDLYRCFELPLGLGADRYVNALEFRPSNPKVVHHAILFIDRANAGAKLESEAGAGYPCFGAPGFLPAAGLGGWSPGSPPIHMPEGVAAVLNKRAGLVIQLHFHPTGRPEIEQGDVALGFTDQPPTRRLADIPLGSRQIDIPPGEKAYKVTDHFTLPVAVDAIGIIPHAHYICREMNGIARLPDGSTRPLIRIADWDFNWQEQYRYARPLHLPADTRLEMEFVYDNSEANPHNPSHPPRRVLWGPGSTDEMAGLHLQVLATRESDFEELSQYLWGKLMRSVGGGFFTLPAKR